MGDRIVKLSITFALDNAALQHEDGALDRDQVADQVEQIAYEIRGTDTEGTIRDYNGNTCGKWEITED